MIIPLVIVAWPFGTNRRLVSERKMFTVTSVPGGWFPFADGCVRLDPSEVNHRQGPTAVWTFCHCGV